MCNPVIRSTHLVPQTFFNFFFKQSGACFSVDRSSILWRGSEKVKKKERCLLWSMTFLTYWILHDAATATFNQWLWQWVYTAFSLILCLWVERLLIWPETETAPSYPCLRQLLISKVRFPISVRIVSAKAFSDKPNSQCKKFKNYSLISQSLSTNLKTKDNCSWLEQFNVSSAKIEKKITFFYVFKSYLRYKMITSQNVSSEVQVKNFFIS